MYLHLVTILDHLSLHQFLQDIKFRGERDDRLIFCDMLAEHFGVCDISFPPLKNVTLKTNTKEKNFYHSLTLRISSFNVTFLIQLIRLFIALLLSGLKAY